MPYELGVDLGTTFTAAAVRDGGDPVMVGLGNRALQVPSVLFRTDEGFVVGEAAERRGSVEPRRLVREFKRRLGDPVPVLVDGVPYSPESLTATLLRWVVDAVTRRQGEPPAGLVLTHPASWGAYKLDVLQQVVVLAEVGPARWCPEPVAAAGQYASRSRVEPGTRLGVYDLGGGTFDACVLEKTPAGFAMLGPAEGVERLGGVDFDEAVFEQVRASLGDRLASVDPDDPEVVAGLARLRRECVDAKEALSVDAETTVPVALPGLLTSVRVTRAELEQLIGPALDTTVQAMARAIRAAGLTPDDLSGLVLVGGSSRIPLVAEVLQRRLGLPTNLDTHPKHDVALGALRSAGPGAAAPVAPSGTARGTTSERRTRPAPAPAATPPTERRTPASPAAAPSPAAPAPTASKVPVGPAAAAVAAVPAAASGTPADGGEDGAGPRSRTRRWLLAGAAALVAAAVVTTVVLAQGRDAPDSRVAAPAPAPASQSGGPTTPTPSPSASLPALPTSAPLADDQLVVTMETKGRWALYLAGTGQSSPLRRLTTGSADDSTPVLSPDRRTVIYQYDADPADPVRTLHVMAADGTGDRELFAQVPSFCAGKMYRPGWSPVDPTLLAVPCTDRSGRYGLYLVRTDGSLVETVHFDGNRADDPTFGPNGRLVFWAGPQTAEQLRHPTLGDGPLWVRELDGTVRQLPGVGTARDGDPAWSPDGTKIAFRRRLSNGTTEGNLDIYVLTLLTGTLTRVVHTPAQEEDPSWSPDGKQLAFKSTEATSAWPGKPVSRTWVIGSDGKHVLLTADAAGRQTAPAWTRR